jgi:hypothetical protein
MDVRDPQEMKGASFRMGRALGVVGTLNRRNYDDGMAKPSQQNTMISA